MSFLFQNLKKAHENVSAVYLYEGLVLQGVSSLLYY